MQSTRATANIAPETAHSRIAHAASSDTLKTYAA
jgi:hypothetical protein